MQRRQRREVALPVQPERHQRRGDQHAQLPGPGEADQVGERQSIGVSLRSAPIAARNGSITFEHERRVEQPDAGPTTTTAVNARPRQPRPGRAASRLRPLGEQPEPLEHEVQRRPAVPAAGRDGDDEVVDDAAEQEPGREPGPRAEPRRPAGGTGTGASGRGTRCSTAGPRTRSRSRRSTGQFISGFASTPGRPPGAAQQVERRRSAAGRPARPSRPSRGGAAGRRGRAGPRPTCRATPSASLAAANAHSPGRAAVARERARVEERLRVQPRPGEQVRERAATRARGGGVRRHVSHLHAAKTAAASAHMTAHGGMASSTSRTADHRRGQLTPPTGAPAGRRCSRGSSAPGTSRSALRPLLLGPLDQLRPVAVVLVARHRVPARVGDPLHLQHDHRADAGGSRGSRPPAPAHSASPGSTARPRPYRRRMRGRPSKAQNITVSRPFSRRWATVSTPLPVRSRYATVVGPRMRNVSSPLGDRLTCPSAAERGGRHEEDVLPRDEPRRSSSSPSNTFPMRPPFTIPASKKFTQVGRPRALQQRKGRTKQQRTPRGIESCSAS